MSRFNENLVSGTANRRKVADGEFDFPPLREQLMPSMDGVTEGMMPLRNGKRRPPMTEGQRKRYRRNIMICYGKVLLGKSERWLADAFDLPRSWIGEIVKQYAAQATAGPDDADD